MLVAHFAHKYAERMAKQIEMIPKDTMEALVRYPWPGNIRELQNFIERAVILTPGDVLRLPALPSIVPVPSEPVIPYNMPVYPGALRVPDNPSGISAVTSHAPISEAEALVRYPD